MSSISETFRTWLLQPILTETKKMEVLMSKLSDEIASVQQDLKDETAALGTVQTDLAALIAKIGSQGNQFTQADLDALTAINTGLQGSVKTLKDADTTIQAALNPPPPTP